MATATMSRWLLGLWGVLAGTGLILAEDRATPPATGKLATGKLATGSSAAVPGEAAKREPPPANADQPEPPVPLNKQETVLLDKPGKRLLLKTRVCLREGALEMLCTLAGAKEHEAILALDAKAYVVHTGLLALGAKPGTPARFQPEYIAPTGQVIRVFVNWTDEQGKAHREPAQNWIRYVTRRFYTVAPYDLPADVNIPQKSELRYDRKLKELAWYGPMSAEQRDTLQKLSRDEGFKKHIASFFEQSQSRGMQADWVFVGSGFYTVPDTGKKLYLAEDGDLICVANFSSATVDVKLRSSAEGESNLLFESWTERVPPRETEVLVELIPVFDDPPAGK